MNSLSANACILSKYLLRQISRSSAKTDGFQTNGCGNVGKRLPTQNDWLRIFAVLERTSNECASPSSQTSCRDAPTRWTPIVPSLLEASAASSRLRNGMHSNQIVIQPTLEPAPKCMQPVSKSQGNSVVDGSAVRGVAQGEAS